MSLLESVSQSVSQYLNPCEEFDTKEEAEHSPLSVGDSSRD